MTELTKRQITEYIQQWGSSTVVESLLNPSCHLFTTPTAKGFIGYSANRKCTAAFGDPVCSPCDRPLLVEAFHEFCDEQKKNVIYLVTSEEFADWMHAHYSSGLLTFGNELYLDPQNDPLKKTGKGGITLRGKLRHAQKNNVVVHEYQNEGEELEHKIQGVAIKWLKTRKGPQIYISRVRLFAERAGKRWFYAECNEMVVGAIVLNRVREGWALDRIMTTAEAPQGTSELLVVSIMGKLAEEGCRFLTFGATNGTTLETIAGFGRYTTFMLPKVYKAALKVFKLQERGKYWEKFHPERAPSYLVFKDPRIGLYEGKCLFKAFNVSL